MATWSPIEELCQDLTCSLCVDFFKDPVMIPECSHSFCQACLAQCWGEAGDQASCPLCKQTVQPKRLQPSQQLANVVEIAKKLSLQGREGGEAGERVCEKHQEPLKLFCQTDQVLICVVCDGSEEHKSHEVIPAGEAFEEYKDKIFRHLETLKETLREQIQSYLADAGNGDQEMLKITESGRQKTVAEFRKLHQLLNEQEKCWLAQVEEVEKEIARRRDEHLARLSEELSSLESLIQEIEEKHQQPLTELLQEVRSTLQRYEQDHVENPVAFPPELKRKLQGCCAIGLFLGGVRKQFQDTLVSALQIRKANVTLDPTTASSALILSKDQRSIKCQRDAQEVPGDHFVHGFVLGCEEFTGGSHFWEVSVGSEEGWAVGVAKEPTSDSETTTIPEKGLWAVGRERGQYMAFVEGTDHPLSLSGVLQRIRVCLYCEGGRVAFFDADSATLLYTFSGVPFSGETLRPYFAVYNKGYLSLSS